MSNNYISSMQFLEKDYQIVSPTLSHSFALRRNIRIKSSKLPHDFFIQPHNFRYGLSPLAQRQNVTDISNRDIRTPSFDYRKFCTSVKANRQNEQRKAQTARPSLQKNAEEDDLDSCLPSSTHRLRREYRKKSIDFKNSFSIDMADKHWRLPKILNRGLAYKK